MQYYVAFGSERRGPFSVEDLSRQGVRPDTMVWREGMDQWQPAGTVGELAALFSGASGQASPPPAYGSPPGYGAPGPLPYQAAPPDVNGKKIAAGVCGILLGGLGIHKFILGLTVPGVIMLVITLVTCGFGGIVTGVIGIVEGIIYLTKSDAEFYQTYMVEKRAWF